MGSRKLAQAVTLETVFSRSNTEVVGSKPTRGMDVCVRLFCVCVVLCACSVLETADPPFKES
jgi:hypothetical protein